MNKIRNFKKIIILIFSIIIFVFIVKFITPFIIENGIKNKKLENKSEYEFKESIKKFDSLREKFEIDLIHKDNLYENFKYNYTIKIPESYNRNLGIGKYSSFQAYNEDLGFVISINVGDNGIGHKIEKKQVYDFVTNLFNELDKSNELKVNFENMWNDRGFNKVRLLNFETSNYNNRTFLRLNFDAFRILDKYNYPHLISTFITFYKMETYIFMFSSNKTSSVDIWEKDIQESMNNVFISEFITNKNK